MELIIGGKSQGKSQYATDIAAVLKADIIDDLQDIIFNAMKLKENPYEKIESILSNKHNCIIICNEIGCGLVPIDEFERDYRDTVGRICCELAKKATRVHRVIAGIGTIIKE